MLYKEELLENQLDDTVKSNKPLLTDDVLLHETEKFNENLMIIDNIIRNNQIETEVHQIVQRLSDICRYFAFCNQYNSYQNDFPFEMFLAILKLDIPIEVLAKILSSFRLIEFDENQINILISTEHFMHLLYNLTSNQDLNEDLQLDIIEIIQKMIISSEILLSFKSQEFFSLLNNLMPRIPTIRLIQTCITYSDPEIGNNLYQILLNHVDTYDELAKYKIIKCIIKILEKFEFFIDERLINIIPSCIQPYNQKLAQYAFEIASYINPAPNFFIEILNFLGCCESSGAALSATNLLLKNYEQWRLNIIQKRIIGILEQIQELPFDCAAPITFALMHYVDPNLYEENEVNICNYCQKFLECKSYFGYFISIIGQILHIHLKNADIEQEFVDFIIETRDIITDSDELSGTQEAEKFLELSSQLLQE